MANAKCHGDAKDGVTPLTKHICGTSLVTDQAIETSLMQQIVFKIYIIITTVYQFTPGIISSLDRLWFTYNPKWLVQQCVLSVKAEF